MEFDKHPFRNSRYCGKGACVSIFVLAIFKSFTVDYLENEFRLMRSITIKNGYSYNSIENLINKFLYKPLENNPFLEKIIKLIKFQYFEGFSNVSKQS